MATTSAPAGASLSSPTPHCRPLTFLGLPDEIQREIFNHVRLFYPTHTLSSSPISSLHRANLTFLSLHLQCSTRELCCLALVSSHFRALAAELIYHSVFVTLPTDHEPHTHRPIDSRKNLPGLLDTLATSDYDYVRHIRHAVFDTVCGSLFAESASRSHHYDTTTSKMLNTLMILAMRKAVGLETLVWNVRVEISPALFKALHSIDTLADLQVRLHAGPSAYRRPSKKQRATSNTQQPSSSGTTTLSASSYFPAPGNAHIFTGILPGILPGIQHQPQPTLTVPHQLAQQAPSVAQAIHQGQALHLMTQPQYGIQPHHANHVMQQLFPNLPNAAGQSSPPASTGAVASHAAAAAATVATVAPSTDPPTFSGFKNLQRLGVLDIDDLSVLPELQACVRNSARTLTQLSLSLSNTLVQKARERGQSHANSTINNNAIFNNNNNNNNNPTIVDDGWGMDDPSISNPEFDTPFDDWVGVGVVGNNSPAGVLGTVGGAGGAGSSLSSSASAASTAAQQTKTLHMQEARREQDAALAHIFGIDPNVSLAQEKKKREKQTETQTQLAKQAEPGSPESTPSGKGKGKAKEQELENAQEQKQPLSARALADTFVEAMQAGIFGLDGPETDADADASSEADRKNLALQQFMQLVKTCIDSASSRAAADAAADEDPTQAASVGEASASKSGSGSKPALIAKASEDDSLLFRDDTLSPTRARGAGADREVLPEDIDIEAPEGQLVLYPHDVPGDKDTDESPAEAGAEVMPNTDTTLASIAETQKQLGKVATADTSNLKKPATLSSNTVTDYARSMRGLSLETLQCYLIPVKASVLAKAIDLRCLVTLTLLNVGPQAAIWTLLAKENLVHRLPLCNIHTDNVGPAFLTCVSQLDNLECLYLLKRSTAKAQPEGAAPRPSPTIEDLRRCILHKHAKSLRVLSIRNQASQDWDLDDATVRLLAKRAPLLRELAASMNMTAVHTLLRCLPGFRALRALHLVHLRNEDTCVWVMQEVRHFLVDTLSHYPHLPLTYLATESAHTIDRIVRVDVRQERERWRVTESKPKSRPNAKPNTKPKQPAAGPSSSTTKTKKKKLTASASASSITTNIWAVGSKGNNDEDGGEDGGEGEDDDDDDEICRSAELELESTFMCNVWDTSIFSKEVINGVI